MQVLLLNTTQGSVSTSAAAAAVVMVGKHVLPASFVIPHAVWREAAMHKPA
jgi:hypothetical protein